MVQALDRIPAGGGRGARQRWLGELAALDWGAGYGYGRQATVTAVEPLRLLVLAPAHLARLMAAAPSVDAAVRRAARERLDRVAADT